MAIANKRNPSRALLWATSALTLVAATHARAGALPTGGAVTSGTAGIASTATQVTVSQSSAKAIVTWSGFSIGQGNTVQFNNGTGSTLNRVTGAGASAIDGALNATGSVYLINQHGIVIGKTGTVNVGGSFVASTLDIPDASYLAGGPLTFNGTSTASVVNLGQIGASGGDVALIAQTVENDGTIIAPAGDVGLLAGSQVTLSDTLSSNGRFQVTLGSGSSATNTGTIQAAIAELRAYGGNVYALAGNTGGSITATGIATNDGQIFLTANAPSGATGVGDITVSDAVAFSGGANALTLDAFHSATIQSPIFTSGGHVSLTTNDAATDGVLSFGLTAAGFSGSLSFLGGAGSGESLTINGVAYTLIYTTDDLQNINNNLGGAYAMANNLSPNGGLLTPVTFYNHAFGGEPETVYIYTPAIIAYDTVAQAFVTQFDFTGAFDGLGHTITGLSISASTGPSDDVGLFGRMSGSVMHLGMVGGGFSGTANVGSLAGDASGGTVFEDYSTATVSGAGNAGGLVGVGNVSYSFATGSVSGGLAGGLVGIGSASDSYATGAVTGTGGGNFGVSGAGGLIGYNFYGVSNSYATGTVSGLGYLGGLASVDDVVSGYITNAYSTGSVASGGGGAVGNGDFRMANNLYWDTDTSGQSASPGGGTGLTTAQMRHAANFVGFDFSPTGPWRIVEGQSFPYLAWQFLATPNVISGDVYSGVGGAAVVGATVGGYKNGAALTLTSSGANGYYQFLLAPGALDNADVVTFLDGAPQRATAFASGITGSVSGLNLYEGALTILTGQSSLSSLTGASFASHYQNAVGGLGGAGLVWSPGTPLTAGVTPGDGLVIDASGDFSVDKSLNLGAGTLVLNAGGAVSETSNAVVWAAGLNGSSSGGAGWTSANNKIGTFSWTNAGAGGVTLDVGLGITVNAVDAGSGDLTIGGPLGFRIHDAGPLTAGGNISLHASHGIDVNGQVTAGGAVTLTGSSVGGVAEYGSGAISAASLGGTANMAVLNGANAVGTITGFATTAGFLFNDTQGLTVTGPITGGSGLLYLTGAGALTIDGSLTSTGNMVLRANGDIAIDAAVNTVGGLALNAMGAVSETGSITADALLGYSAGSTDLSGSNTINTLLGYRVYHGGATLTVSDLVHLTVAAPVAAYAVSFTDPAELSITGSGSVTAFGGSRTLNGAPF